MTRKHKVHIYTEYGQLYEAHLDSTDVDGLVLDLREGTHLTFDTRENGFPVTVYLPVRRVRCVSVRKEPS